MGVVPGATQVSCLVTDPVDPGSPVLVEITDKIYDPQNNLIETDVTSYTLTASGVLALVSASAQSASGSLKVTAP